MYLIRKYYSGSEKFWRVELRDNGKVIGAEENLSKSQAEIFIRGITCALMAQRYVEIVLERDR